MLNNNQSIYYYAMTSSVNSKKRDELSAECLQRLGGKNKNVIKVVNIFEFFTELVDFIIKKSSNNLNLCSVTKVWMLPTFTTEDNGKQWKCPGLECNWKSTKVQVDLKQRFFSDLRSLTLKLEVFRPCSRYFPHIIKISIKSQHLLLCTKKIMLL